MIKTRSKEDIFHDIEQHKRLDNYLSHSVTANYTFTDSDKIKTLFVTTGASTITATLPTAADNLYRVIEIIKIDSGSGKVTVDGEGAETINGNATIDLFLQYRGIRIKSYGTGWYIVDVMGADGITYKWDELDASVNIGTSDTDLSNLTYTVAESGIFEVHACISFSNSQSPTSDQRWCALKLYKDATLLSFNQHQILDATVGTGNDFIVVSLNWMGSLTAGEILKLKARAQTASIITAYGGALNPSHWLIKRYDNNLVTTL